MGRKDTVPFVSGPQFEIQMYDYATQIGQFKDIAHQIKKASEVEMLKKAGVKFNEKDVVFAIKDKRGNLLWLETGNDKAGLKHIVKNHKNDYQAVYGVGEKDIPGFIKNLLSSGNLLGERRVIKNGKKGFERTYEYDNKHYTVAGIGENGFIVSVYPFRRN